MTCIRLEYAVILLPVFVTIITDTYAENFIRDDKVRSGVLLHLLKAPWINLNSSWENGVASTCKNDITTLFKSAEDGEMWALRMLDASSKIPSGILTGNIHDLGMYDECIGIKSHENPAGIQGRHCMVSMSMSPEFVKDAVAILNVQHLSPYNPSAGVNLSLTASVCLPSSCNVDDVAGFVDSSLPNLEFEVRVDQVTCSSVGAAENFTLGTIVTISLFTVLALFLVFCTACEYIVRVRSDDASKTLRNLAKFSLYTNTIDLLSTEIQNGTMPAIHGIRFLSTCLILVSHRVLSAWIMPQVNLASVLELRNSWLAAMSSNALYAVDTFFLLGSFLTTHSFLKKLKSTGKLDLIEFYRHRYLRVAPVIAALILFTIFIIPHLGSGPLWETVVKATTNSCRRNWWTNLLFVQNLVNRKEMCLIHTWYLAVDMQLFWISPIILYPLFYRPKLGLTMLGTFIIVSFIAPALQIIVMKYSVFFNVSKTFAEIYNEFFDSYTMPFNRALPYGVGMLLGYYVENNEKKLSKAQVMLNWSLACIALLFCAWNGTYIQPIGAVYDVIWEASYVSVGRLAWSLAFAWIVYACIRGHGGPITRICSRPIFVPLTRMSFGIYVSSLMIQLGINATIRTADFYTDLALTYIFWSDLAVSFAVAFVLNLCIETPVSVLEKLLKDKSKRPAKIAKDSPIINDEKLSALIAEYLDLAKGRSDTESISARMSEPDFWEIVSDALNTLSKGTNRTPDEWAKVWHDWESNLVKNHTQSEPLTSRDVNAEPQIESNLLFFLAAVRYGLDDKSLKRRRIRDSQKQD